MNIILSKCAECKHLIVPLKDFKLKCEVYPDGVPLEVFKSNENVRCSEKITFESED